MDDQNTQAAAPKTENRPVEFKFEGQPVRTIMKEDRIWFVTGDICDVLEIKNPRDAVARLDEDERGVGRTDTLGGPQDLNVVNESGLYVLIFTSRKPQAKKFRKWVTNEVLPSIRKTGRYDAAKQPALSIRAAGSSKSSPATS
jgi:anti-repressor protein